MSMMLRCIDNGLLVKSYDPDFIPPAPNPPWPNGIVGFTADPAQAMRFPDAGAALRCWQAQSVTLPFRPTDGLPNKPLTALTMLLEPVED